MAYCCIDLGDLQAQLGFHAEAIRSAEQTEPIYRELLATQPDSSRYRQGLILSVLNQGEFHADLGHVADAMAAFQTVLSMTDRFGETDVYDQKKRGSCLYFRGNLQCWTAGSLDDALSSFHQARDIQQRLLAANPADAGLGGDLARTLVAIGVVHHSRVERPQALEFFSQARELYDAIVGQAPALTSGWCARARNSIELANLLCDMHKPEESLPLVEDALQNLKRLVASNPEDLNFQCELARAWDSLANAQAQLGVTTEAVAAYEQAAAHHQAILAKAPQVIRYQQYFKLHRTNLARLVQKAEFDNGGEAQ